MWAGLALAGRLARAGLLPMLRLILVSAVVSGAVIYGSTPAAAQPADYAALPVDPNVVTDSSAYWAAPAIVNPDGQSGVETVFTHRDSTRQIADAILVFADPPAATAALVQRESSLGAAVAGPTRQQVPVGEGGTVTSGSTPGGAQSISVLLFTQGNAMAQVEFTGSPEDPAPTDLVVEYGQQQANAIEQQLAG